MKMKTLGRTNVQVSEICLGTMTWGKQNTEADGHAQMDYAIEHGINFFDTAEMYAVPPDASTYGKTEEIIGTWFEKTGKRDQVVLASKVAGGGRPWVREGRGIDAAGVREKFGVPPAQIAHYLALVRRTGTRRGNCHSLNRHAPGHADRLRELLPPKLSRHGYRAGPCRCAG